MTHKCASLCLSAVALLVWAGPAEAQVARPLSGRAQFQIGNGLPIPVMPGTPSCVPNGGIDGIKAVKGAMITTTGGVGGSFMIPANQFTLRGPGNPQLPQVEGIATQNPVVFQVYTNLVIRIPNPGVTVHPGQGFAPKGGSMGRTGPDVVSWCPGYTATVTMGTPMGGNPGCINPGTHKAVNIFTCGASPNPCPGPNKAKVVIPGFMKYTRTGKMLGGPGSGTLSGSFNVATAVGGGAFFVPGKPPANLPHGRPFGAYFQQNAGKGALRAPVMANSCGVINSVGQPILEKAASNRTTASFGGPLTQGMLTLVVDTGLGNESYKISGYDKRTAMGAGKIQLVGGALGIRSMSGQNANRGFIRLEVPEPAAIVGTVAALLVVAGCHRALRRRPQ